MSAKIFCPAKKKSGRFHWLIVARKDILTSDQAAMAEKSRSKKSSTGGSDNATRMEENHRPTSERSSGRRRMDEPAYGATHLDKDQIMSTFQNVPDGGDDGYAETDEDDEYGDEDDEYLHDEYDDGDDEYDDEEDDEYDDEEDYYDDDEEDDEYDNEDDEYDDGDDEDDDKVMEEEEDESLSPGELRANIAAMGLCGAYMAYKASSNGENLLVVAAKTCVGGYVGGYLLLMVFGFFYGLYAKVVLGFPVWGKTPDEITEELNAMLFPESSEARKIARKTIRQMAPLAISEKLYKEISILPSNDRVYMVDFFSRTQHDVTQSSGFVTEETCQCGLVEKEVGSNGKHWNHSGIGGAESEADGLSYSVAVSAHIFDGQRSDFDICRLMVLGTIAKACKEPGGARMGQSVSDFPIQPSRPRKVLFASQGFMSSVEPHVKSMGIPEVGVADKELIASMKSSFSEGTEYGEGPLEEKLMKAMVSGNMSEIIRLSSQRLWNKNTNNDTSYYVSEERVSLGWWWPDPIEDGAIPMEWFARPPSETVKRPRMLWGWRTNMELATERNDSDKIKDICRRYPSNKVKEFVEMRMLLSKSAERGTAEAGLALLEYANADVDGVRSKKNKRKWRPMQETTGDNGTRKGCTPLFLAIQEGHEDVVRLLIQHGANIRFSPKGSLLHFAVAKGHQSIVEQLVLAGADLEARDTRGHTPMDVCMAQLEWGGHGTKQYEAISKMLQEFQDRTKRRASCKRKRPDSVARVS